MLPQQPTKGEDQTTTTPVSRETCRSWLRMNLSRLGWNADDFGIDAALDDWSARGAAHPRGFGWDAMATWGNAVALRVPAGVVSWLGSPVDWLADFWVAPRAMPRLVALRQQAHPSVHLDEVARFSADGCRTDPARRHWASGSIAVYLVEAEGTYRCGETFLAWDPRPRVLTVAEARDRVSFN